MGWDSHKRQEVSGTLTIDTIYTGYSAGNDHYGLKVLVSITIWYLAVKTLSDEPIPTWVAANTGNGARDGYCVKDGYTSVSYQNGFDEEVHDIAPSQHYVKLNIYSLKTFWQMAACAVFQYYE